MNEARSRDQLGLSLILGSFLFLGLVFGLVSWRSASSPALDPLTLRASGRPVTGELAILLDVTDSFSPNEQSSVVEWLREYQLTNLQVNERVSLWALGSGEAGGLKRLFCRYYPGLEQDPWLHNPARIAARTDSLFTQPLQDAVLTATVGKPLPRSPILAALRVLSEQPELADASVRRHLIIISDLEENTKGLSFYRGVPVFGTFVKSTSFQRSQADLTGMTVDVLHIPRGNAAATMSPDLTEFWRRYLRECGASSVRIRRL
jgi:hypothetical protein